MRTKLACVSCKTCLLAVVLLPAVNDSWASADRTVDIRNLKVIDDEESLPTASVSSKSAFPLKALGARAKPNDSDTVVVSNNSASTPGGPCIGSSLSSAGDCSTVAVTDETGEKHVVQMYCYAPTPVSPSTKAGRNEDGMCYVPRTRPCESTKQCRPGTGCRPQPQVESGPTLPYVCSVLEPEVDDGSADTVAQLVTKIAFDLKNAINDNDGINATGAVQDSEGNLVLQDFHSGVLSPYLAFRNLAKHVFQDMIDSFWGAHVRHHGDSSRSGASFFYSADSLFIAKKLSRVAEWEDMVIHLLGKLASQLDFADPICDESVESCWALHAMQKTVLNIPVLAFKHHSEAWVIIPNTPVMRCYTMVGEHPGRAMQAGREGKPCPLDGAEKPETFDVKPLWAHSNQRAAFIHAMASANFRPACPGAPEPQKELWKRTDLAITRAIRLLGKGHFPFIDYSLLVEVHRPREKLTDAGPHCVPAASCYFAEDNSTILARTLRGVEPGCTVFCFNIIDYFLRYDSFMKGFQSVLVHHKWHDYGKKVSGLVWCIGELARSTRRPNQATWNHVVGPLWVEENSNLFVLTMEADKIPSPQSFTVTSSVYFHPGAFPCMGYLETFCPVYKLRSTEPRTCVAKGSFPIVAACQPYFASACAERY